MDQLPLFLDDRALDRLWTECLGNADFDGAEDALREQQRLYPDQQDLAGKEQGLAFLRSLLELPQEPRIARLAVLVRAWRREPVLHGLHPDPKWVERAIVTALAKQLAPGRTASLPNGLLPAEVAVRRGGLDAALTCVVDSLRDLGEHAFLRQLQAWVLWRQESPGSAGVCLALALCHDAAACRHEFLFDSFAALFRRIRPAAADAAEAMQAMAFGAWSEGKLPIPPNNPGYETFLRCRLATAPQAPGETLVRGQRFLQFLFLAEGGRLRAEPVNALLPWREAMRQLDPERFQQYMAIIA